MSDLDRAEALTHITRTGLPWRDADKTVCGKPISQYRPELVVNLADALAMQRRLGKQRFALAICMTCAHHVDRWVEWDANPVRRFERELSGNGFNGRGSDGELVERELRAIAALIAAHRAEFDDMVAALSDGSVVTMQQLRQKRAAR